MTADTHVGRLIWLAKGSRPDINVAVTKLARRLHDWAALEDMMLDRLYRYLEIACFMGLYFMIHPADIDQLAIVTDADADLGNDYDKKYCWCGYLY